MNGANSSASSEYIPDPPNSGFYMLVANNGNANWVLIPNQQKGILTSDNGTITSLPLGNANQLLNGSGGWTDTEACT